MNLSFLKIRINNKIKSMYINTNSKVNLFVSDFSLSLRKTCVILKSTHSTYKNEALIFKNINIFLIKKKGHIIRTKE